jgi:hypothetical protein
MHKLVEHLHSTVPYKKTWKTPLRNEDTTNEIPNLLVVRLQQRISNVINYKSTRENHKQMGKWTYVRVPNFLFNPRQ